MYIINQVCRGSFIGCVGVILRCREVQGCRECRSLYDVGVYGYIGVGSVWVYDVGVQMMQRMQGCMNVQGVREYMVQWYRECMGIWCKGAYDVEDVRECMMQGCRGCWVYWLGSVWCMGVRSVWVYGVRVQMVQRMQWYMSVQGIGVYGCRGIKDVLVYKCIWCRGIQGVNGVVGHQLQCRVQG